MQKADRPSIPGPFSLPGISQVQEEMAIPREIADNAVRVSQSSDSQRSLAAESAGRGRYSAVQRIFDKAV